MSLLKKLVSLVSKLLGGGIQDTLRDVLGDRIEALLASVRNLPWQKSATLNGRDIDLRSAKHAPQLSGAPFVFTFTFVDRNGAGHTLVAAYSPRNLGNESVVLDGVVQDKPNDGGCVGLAGKVHFHGVTATKADVTVTARYVVDGAENVFAATAEITALDLIGLLLD